GASCGSGRPHPAADLGLHRLRGRPVARVIFGLRPGLDATGADLRRVYAVQLHDQHGTECADLPVGRRGVPDPVARHGAGFAAAVAKVGAGMTAFLFPILLKDLGTQTLLLILVGTSLLGAVITGMFRIETMGVSLEKMG